MVGRTISPYRILEKLGTGVWAWSTRPGISNLESCRICRRGCNAQKVLPEADSMNFASRVKVPVLMINGRYDFEVPLKTCQEPLFRLLGVPP